MTTCEFCGRPSFLGPLHPCCEETRSRGLDKCIACAESIAAERKHQQRAASCQCDEHARRRAA